MTKFQILQEIGRLEEENAALYEKVMSNEERIDFLEVELEILQGE